MNPREQAELTIVIPIYNEEENLPNLLSEIVPICSTHNFRAIFINDGSKDNSKEFLTNAMNDPYIDVIHHKVNKGYGAALKSGLRAAKTEYVITFDGDGQHSVDDIVPTLNFAKANDADMVVGNRGSSVHGQHFREFGKLILRGVAKMLMDLQIKDLNSGFKLYKTEMVQNYLPFCPNTMAFSDIITLIFINNRNLVLERPITIRPRTTGKSTINISTAFETLGTILNVAVMFNPYKLFMPPAFLCLILGLAWGIPIAIQGRGVSVGSLLLITLAAFLFTIGLVASQLSAIRMQMLEEYQIKRRRLTSPQHFNDICDEEKQN